MDRPVMRASTFSGNALTMAAGCAAMSAFNVDEIKRTNELGILLREDFNRAFLQSGIKERAVGCGFLTNIIIC